MLGCAFLGRSLIRFRDAATCARLNAQLGKRNWTGPPAQLRGAWLAVPPEGKANISRQGQHLYILSISSFAIYKACKRLAAHEPPEIFKKDRLLPHAEGRRAA